MPQILIQLEPSTLEAIDRIASVAKRKRADFIRKAIKDAIFRHEQQGMRRGYELQPDSAGEVDEWDVAEVT